MKYYNLLLAIASLFSLSLHAAPSLQELHKEYESLLDRKKRLKIEISSIEKETKMNKDDENRIFEPLSDEYYIDVWKNLLDDYSSKLTTLEVQEKELLRQIIALQSKLLPPKKVEPSISPKRSFLYRTLARVHLQDLLTTEAKEKRKSYA